MLVAQSGEGRSQRPVATLVMPDEPWDVVSDGRPVFAVPGKALDARIDEVEVAAQ